METNPGLWTAITTFLEHLCFRLTLNDWKSSKNFSGSRLTNSMSAGATACSMR